MKNHRFCFALSVPLLVILGCTYQRPQDVTLQMARTEAILQQAESSGVQVKSLPDLQAAKDKFAQAQESFEQESEEGDRIALQLAKEAEVDAQYASAKAQSTTQKDAAREVESGVEALRDEATRNASVPVVTTP